MHQRPVSTAPLAANTGVNYSTAATPIDAKDVETVKKESWNRPRANIYRTVATAWSFIVMGLHVASFGPLIPYIATYYSLSYTTVSLIFLTNVFGYIAAATTSNTIHNNYGRRGIAIVGPLCMIAAYVAIRTRPPFPIVIAALVIAGYGIGLQDVAWNAYIGNLADPNTIVGVLQGLFGLGAIGGPYIATVMVTEAHLPWFNYFDFLLSASCLTFLGSVLAFWKHNAGESSGSHHDSSGTHRVHYTNTTPHDEESHTQLVSVPTLRHVLSWNRHTVLRVILFIVCYAGIETGLSGWITVYFLKMRQADAYTAGMVGSGFWLGLCIGRIILGPITNYLGERRAVIGYAITTIILQGLFAVIPGIGVPALIIGVQGFMLGPMFPTGVVVLTSQLPENMHVQALALMCSSGVLGGSLFAFVIGAMADRFSVGLLVPVIFGLLICMLAAWLAVAIGSGKQEMGGDDREPLLAPSTEAPFPP